MHDLLVKALDEFDEKRTCSIQIPSTSLQNRLTNQKKTGRAALLREELVEQVVPGGSNGGGGLFRFSMFDLPHGQINVPGMDCSRVQR